MKKQISLILLLFIGFYTHAQIDINGDAISSFSHTFIPSNFNPKDLKPSDIPSESVLRQMGLSDKEITEVLKYKNGTGKNDYN